MKKLVSHNNPILFSTRPFSFRLKCINCCDNCDDPIFIQIFLFLDPTSYQHCSRRTYGRRNRTVAEEKLGSYRNACLFFFFFLLYSSAHNLKSILHITCDELLEIGINLFFGIGNYDVIQNGGTNAFYYKLSLNLANVCQRK